MTKLDHRKSNVILEELEELNSLIVKDREFVAQFPADISLQIGLESLEYRQSQLFLELESAKRSRGQETFDVVLTGEGVAGTEISSSLLGGFLSHYQNIITAIVHQGEKGEILRGPIPNGIRFAAQVNVIATAAGSFRLILSTNPEILDSPVSDALTKFNQIVESGDDIRKIREIGDRLGPRVLNEYENFLKEIKYHGATVTFYEKMGRDGFCPLTISKEFAERTCQVLNNMQQRPEEIESYNGKIRAIDTIDKSFRFEVDEGDIVRGKYDETLEDELKQGTLNTPVIVKMKHSVSYYEATDKVVDEWRLTEIN